MILLLLACTASKAPPVQARMLYGSMSQVRLDESGLKDLGTCARKAEKQGEAVGGEVEVELNVLEGEVLLAEVVQVPGDSERLGECIVDRASRWRFDSELDGEVHAGATIVAQEPQSAVELTDAAAVQQVMAHYPELRACYEDRLLDMPQLKGRLSLRLEVEGGVVTEVQFTGEDLDDDPLRQCIARAAEGWAFEPERTGVVATQILLMP